MSAENQSPDAWEPREGRLSTGAVVVLVAVAVFVGAVATWLVVADPLELRDDAPARRAAAAASSAAAADSLWTCGMHPSVMQDEPGTCPICQMDLTPMSSDAEQAASAELYTCPMHPEVLSDEPGACPICGMDLVPVDVGDDAATAMRATTHDHAAHADAEPWVCPLHPEHFRQDEPGACKICGLELVRESQAGAPTETTEPVAWTCPMHPSVVRDAPGSCPICGMDLVPREEPAATGPSSRSGTTRPSAGGGGEILYWRHPHDPSIVSPEPRRDEMGMEYVPVRAAVHESGDGPVVTVPPGIVQEMNVVLGEVTSGDLTKDIRTVGTLDFDAARMVSVTTKYSGFVERVHANYLGQAVRRGDPLFDVYSPELVQTQEELLSALRYAERLQDASDETRRRAEGLVEAARRRLELWDVTGSQVRRIERDGAPLRTITVTSPASGVIMKRMPGLEGMAIRPGMEVLHVADLSVLWLEVQVYEHQLPFIEPGAVATVTFPAMPAEAMRGRVQFIEPAVEAATRTATVTLELPNPDARLRVGQFANVRFDPVVVRDAVLVPSEAVLRTGERDLVVLALGEGRFAPREVVLGPEGDTHVAVLAGLRPGQRIVVSGQFLLASESRLREAVLKMIAERRGE